MPDSSWTDTKASLSSASVSAGTATGSPIDLEQVLDRHVIQVTVDTGPVDGASVVVSLLLSLDGVAYVNPVPIYTAPFAHGLNTVIVTVDTPARFVMAQASSGLTLSPPSVVTTLHSSTG